MAAIAAVGAVLSHLNGRDGFTFACTFVGGWCAHSLLPLTSKDTKKWPVSKYEGTYPNGRWIFVTELENVSYDEAMKTVSVMQNK